MKACIEKAIMTARDRHDACQIMAYARLRVDKLAVMKKDWSQKYNIGVRYFLSRCIDHVQNMEVEE